VRRRIYEANAGKHGREARGRVSREPRNGQEALDLSVPIKPSSAGRMSIDYEERVFVMLRRHSHVPSEWPNAECYHGYVVEWAGLTDEMRNPLIKAGMANRKGRIL